MCVFSCVQLFLVPWIIVCQAPMSMDFTRQEYWSVLPFCTRRDLPNPGIEPASLMSPALKGRFFTNDATWEAQLSKTWINYSFPLLYFQLLPLMTLHFQLTLIFMCFLYSELTVFPSYWSPVSFSSVCQHSELCNGI